MAEREKQQEFVVTDRRKFRFDGEPVTPSTDSETATAVAEPAPEPVAEPQAAPEAGMTSQAKTAPTADQDADGYQSLEGHAPEDHSSADNTPEDAPPAGPSEQDIAASQQAYAATAERMDDIVRASNPGAPHDGPVTFDRVIQSLYITAIVQLGLNTPPGQQMRVDLLAARHSIDMLGVLAEKVKGNATADEDKLLQTALFELRMSFLEVTQMLAQNAQSKNAQAAPGKLKI